MKKLPALLNTPARTLIAVGMIILVSELLIMVVIEGVTVSFITHEFWHFIDPILLIAIVSPTLYLLIFRPLNNQQTENKRQLDELRRFHDLSIGRELRMKELVEEIAVLRHPLSAEKAGDIPATRNSLEKPHDAASQYATAQPTEQNQLSALLFILEDLENAHRKVEQAHQEWIAALDVVDDPIFLHDQQLRVLRCNKAYQQLAGIPFKQIIGQPYYDVFPKADTPLSCCLQAMEEAEEEVAVGDAIYRSRAFSIKDERGACLYSVHTFEDITERKRAAEELRLRVQLLDSASDTIFVLDFNGNFVYLNEAAWKTRGYTRDEMMSLNLHALDTPKYEKLIELRMRELMEKGQNTFESAHRRKDGSVMPVEINARIIESGGRKLVLSVIRDITERKQAEEALKESEEKYRSIYENSQIGLYRTRVSDGKLMMANDAMAKMFGFDSIEEAIAKYITSEHYVDPWIRERLLDALQKYGRFDNLEACLTRSDGITRWFQYSGRLVQNKDYIEGVATDITERKQAEQELKSLSDRLQHILASTPAVHYACRIDGECFVPTYASPNLKGIWGYDPTEYLGNAEWWWSSIHPEGRDSVAGTFRAAIMATDCNHYAHEYLFRRKDGAYRWVHDELQIIRDQAGQPLEIVGSWLDITERKQAEAAIQHANRALATLSAVNRTLVHATDENELLQAICQAIVKQRGYRMAWVGYKHHDESKSIKIMARAGHDEGYLDAMQLTWAETERGMGASGRTIRSGATQLCQDIASDPLYLPWRDAALKRGYVANIALPLLSGDNAVFGVLNVYAAEANAFTPAEVELLEEMAGDLVFGVRSLHIRHERDLAQDKVQQQLVQLQDSLEDTVRAMAGLVEMRDPYTAGHQSKVADLAAAIAKQMGLPDEQVHGIHLAGVVHDLGKIKIPAEILSKPGKITDLEFGLIKVHPQAGYDILKGINFPWPIAQMVLQHHERLDGSGYPQGLKGEAILFEARILAVADVIEAISAHRPYRPGFGVEAALEEVTRQRGIHYDPRVVDACLALFREQHYSFKS